MPVIWNDEEIALLETLRPSCNSKEIQEVLKKLGHDRTLEAIAKKGQLLNIPANHVDFPNLNGLDTETVQAITSVLGNRTETINEAKAISPDNPNGLTTKGVSTLTDSLGNVKLQWTKKTNEAENRETVLKRLVKEIPLIVAAREKVKTPKIRGSSSNMLSVYPMGDPHVGMLSWKEETGEDFNLKRAEKDLCIAMRHLVQQGDPTDTALIVNLGDFFHTDNNTNQTNRNKNPLDVDGRWPKVLRVGLAAMITCIESALERHKMVKVINEIGNHDDHSSIFLAVALDAYYHREPRVEVDLSTSKFHWSQFGKCLIGVTHGDTVKPKDLEAIMSCDQPESWGNTEHRYWYIGHIHHQSKYEFRGCTVESFRTLTPKDAWHHSHGYRSRCDMTKIILHEEHGEIFRATVDSGFLKVLRTK